MRSRPQLCSVLSRFVVAIFALTIGFQASSQAAVQDRIVGGVHGSSRVALAHTVAPKAALAQDLGAAPSSQKLETMTMRFSMTDAQQAALDQLLLDQQNPASPRFRQWLTPEQFGAQFGLSAADLATVSSWLTSQGFTITGTAKSSTFITFSGTVGQAQQAFGTTIHNLDLNGERHIANLTEPTLPVAIAGVVSNIRGLDDFKLRSRARKIQHRTTATDPKYTISVCTNSACTATEIEHYISPGDFATIYDTAPLLSGGINGSGITIAVMGQVNISSYLTDVAAFRTASGLIANAPTQQIIGTDPGAPSATSCAATDAPTTCDDLDESELDLEWAGAVAPSAKILFVTSTDVIEDSLVTAIDNNLAPIMTVSYGGCEVQNFSTASMTSLSTVFQQANAEGITILGPSGDTGATDCDPATATSSPTVATLGLAVDFPASSPNVTGVGGTEFNEGPDAGSTGTYWNNSTASTAPISSALSYIPEMVWNDTASEIASNPTSATFSSGGGGASVFFPKPTWQTGVGVPADGHRDVPDVALSASAEHDAYIVCAIGSCQNNTFFVTATGSFNAFGGTSVSTPSFAGILALVEQKLGGSRLGNINPYLYALANGGSYATIFHDVTTGNNKQLCAVGSTGCTASPIGYSAGVGYDQASGLGSVDASQFAGKFSTAVGTLPNTSTTTVTFSPSSPALNQAVTFTATVGHTSGSAAPTGTVAFTVDGGASTAEPLNSAGVATFSPTFTTNGTHTVYAVYSGDANYYGSSSTTSIITGTVPTGTISLSASPATITVASAGNITSTVTVTSAGGYAGTVNLTAVAPSLNGSYTFTATTSTPTCNATASTITLAVGGSGTCTFTVSAVSATVKGSGGFNHRVAVSSIAVGGSIAFASIFMFGLGSTRRKRLPTMLSLLVLAGLMTGVGCSSSSSTTPTTTTTATATGPYTITITGTDSLTNAITASTAITVTIN
jgi:hypothetical protein